MRTPGDEAEGLTWFVEPNERLTGKPVVLP